MGDVLNHQWCVATLADAVESTIRREEAALRLAQSVGGIDGRDELCLHELLAAGFHHETIGVHREIRYPAVRSQRRRSEGDRCDLVLTPDHRPLCEPEAADTLFIDESTVALEDAFWMEVKVVAQFHEDGGNVSYASSLRSAVREDVTKLSRDRGILHAGLLILLFTAAAQIAEHDLGIWQDECLQRCLPIAAPATRHVPIADRLGNRCCTIRLYPVRHL